MKIIVVFVLTLVALVPVAGIAEPTVRLRMSATIMPKACNYPDRCETVTRNLVPVAATRVVVSDGNVSYVGLPPTVEEQGDVLLVKF